MVGATFMHIDKGIDTGEIIQQIRADICFGDGPHSIGSRLIAKMTDTYIEIIKNYFNLAPQKQPKAEGKVYYQKDFDSIACDLLYKNFSQGMVEDFLVSQNNIEIPYIVENKLINI